MKEYGGCLPTEAFLADRPVVYFEKQAVKMNSGRAAIYLAAVHAGSRAVWLPYYTCPTIKEFLEGRGLPVKEYSIDADFLPCTPTLAEGETLVWTDYYGCMRPETIQTAMARYGRRLILDHCQGILRKPLEGVYNVYSLRKFIGVSSGAVLYHSGFTGERLDLPPTQARDEFLEEARWEGSNAAYNQYFENEECFRTEYGAMPQSVEETIRRVDFVAIQSRRRENFQAAHNVLGFLNQLEHVDFSGDTPYMYPYLSNRPGLREHLLEQQIFCPTWWRRVLTLEETSSFEKELVRRLVPIPIDQRYSSKDVLEVCRTVRDWEAGA